MRKFEKMTTTTMKDSSMTEEEELTCNQYIDKFLSAV